MAQRDARPPFAAIGGTVPPEFAALPTPCYLLDEAALTRNAKILGGLARRTGCKVLLAQKAFSNYDLYPLLAPYLAGTEASGLFEARLGAEEMPGREVHVFCAAYRADEMDELLQYADHIVFNSPAQLAKFGPKAKAAGKSVGLRINPECSTQDGHAIYDPCAPGSRGGPCGVREIDVDDFGRGGRVAPLLYHGFGVETPRNRAPCGGYGCRQGEEGKDFLHGEIKGWRINGQGRPCWRRGLAECLCYVSGSVLFAGESLGALEILVIADARLGFEGRIILGQCLIDCGLGLVVFHLVEHGGLLEQEKGSVVGIVVRD